MAQYIQLVDAIQIPEGDLLTGLSAGDWLVVKCTGDKLVFVMTDEEFQDSYESIEQVEL